jgi:hypothetical protein
MNGWMDGWKDGWMDEWNSQHKSTVSTEPFEEAADRALATTEAGRAWEEGSPRDSFCFYISHALFKVLPMQ